MGDETTSNGSKKRRSVGPRKEQFLIAKRPGPTPFGLQPLSLDMVKSALERDPEIQVKRLIKPRGIGLLGETTAEDRTVIVAELAPDRVAMLAQQPQLLCEPDRPVTYAEPMPEIRFDPGIVVPSATGFEATIVVTGPDDTPVEGATVALIGTAWPGQGVTDAAGRVTVRMLADSPSTVRALYVKPRADHWSLYLGSPSLDPAHENRVVLSRIEQVAAPGAGGETLGWGQLSMRLDQVPPELRGKGVKVAVIDSGTATSHRDLAAARVGIDVVSGNAEGWHDDAIAHGSHCAGIIVGAQNGAGIRGFAPDAELLTVKIFPDGRFSHIIEALNFCIERGADVVNLSLGSEEPSLLVEQKILEAKHAGIACIVAAGNSASRVQFPARLPHVLAVSAIGRRGQFPEDSYHAQAAPRDALARVTPEGYFAARFSCHGPEIGVCGPGVAVISSVPSDNFAAWDGTSMAAPHVTGLAALVLAHHPDFKGRYLARNAARVDRLFQILRESALPIDVGDRTRVGAGLPDAPRALGLQVRAPVGIGVGAPASDVLEQVRRVLEAAGVLSAGPSAVGPGVTPASVGGAFNVPMIPPPPSAREAMDDIGQRLRAYGII